ncbi:hypothetical protein MRX96_052973, partial [Rhipicephalus microplus]
ICKRESLRESLAQLCQDNANNTSRSTWRDCQTTGLTAPPRRRPLSSCGESRDYALGDVRPAAGSPKITWAGYAACRHGRWRRPLPFLLSRMSSSLLLVPQEEASALKGALAARWLVGAVPACTLGSPYVPLDDSRAFHEELAKDKVRTSRVDLGRIIAREAVESGPRQKQDVENQRLDRAPNPGRSTACVRVYFAVWRNFRAMTGTGTPWGSVGSLHYDAPLRGSSAASLPVEFLCFAMT